MSTAEVAAVNRLAPPAGHGPVAQQQPPAIQLAGASGTQTTTATSAAATVTKPAELTSTHTTGRPTAEALAKLNDTEIINQAVIQAAQVELRENHIAAQLPAFTQPLQLLTTETLDKLFGAPSAENKAPRAQFERAVVGAVAAVATNAHNPISLVAASLKALTDIALASSLPETSRVRATRRLHEASREEGERYFSNNTSTLMSMQRKIELSSAAKTSFLQVAQAEPLVALKAIARLIERSWNLPRIQVSEVKSLIGPALKSEATRAEALTVIHTMATNALSATESFSGSQAVPRAKLRAELAQAALEAVEASGISKPEVSHVVTQLQKVIAQAPIAAAVEAKLPANTKPALN